MKPVSLTAQWTAAIRALETEEAEQPLFFDKWARALAQPDDTHIYEVDHEALIAEKRRRLKTANAFPTTQRIEVPADLALLGDAHLTDCINA